MSHTSTVDAEVERRSCAPLSNWQSSLECVLRVNVAASRSLAIFGGLLIVAAGFLICIEVILRKAAGVTTGVTDELSTYAFAIGSTLAFSHCLIERAHIRIDSASKFLPSNFRMALDFVALAALAAFFAIVAWFAVDTSWTSFLRGSRAVTQLQTPLFVPQGLWAAALVFFVVVAIIVFLAAAGRLVRGDAAGTRSLIATRSGEAEAEVQL